jgi:hypothetical protein
VSLCTKLWYESITSCIFPKLENRSETAYAWYSICGRALLDSLE